MKSKEGANGRLDVLDITGIRYRARTEKRKVWPDAVVTHVSKVFDPRKQGQECQNGGFRFQVKCRQEDKDDDEDEQRNLWDLRDALSMFGAVKTLDGSQPDYVVIFYQRRCTQLFYENQVLKVEGKRYTLRKLSIHYSWNVSWGLWADEFFFGTEIRYIRNSSTANIEIEGFEGDASLVPLTYIGHVDGHRWPIVLTIINKQFENVEIYLMLETEREKDFDRHGRDISRTRTPIKIVIAWRSLREHILHFAETLPKFDRGWAGWTAKFAHARRTTYWAWMNLKFPPEIYRAPIREDATRVTKVKNILARYEWLQTITYTDFQAGVRDKEMSTAKVESMLNSWGVERALVTLLRHSGFILRWKAPKDGSSLTAHKIRAKLNISSLQGQRGSLAALGPKPILFVKFCAALERTVDFTKEFFRRLVLERSYFVCGYFLRLVLSDYLPRRWLCSHMTWTNKHLDNPEKFPTEAALVLILDRKKLSEVHAYYILRNLVQMGDDSGYVRGFANFFALFQKEACRVKPELPQQRSDQSSLFHIYVTPTKTFVDGPFAETNNRVLRSYHNESERFMRATFCNVQRGSLFFNTEDATLLAEKMVLVFKAGIHLGCQRFSFLSYGTSQLKSKSFWTLNESETLTVRSVVAKMGNFTSQFVGKLAARHGQCFSSTTPTIRLSAASTVCVDDIVSPVTSSPGSKDFIFTDGVGAVRKEFMDEVAGMLRLEFVPSAIQIRFEGYKGMLALQPCAFEGRNDTAAIGGSIKCIFRTSQKKFQANLGILEVCDQSRPTILMLNKQMIALLDTLGIPHKNILDMVDKQFGTMMKIYSRRECALAFIKQCMTPSSICQDLLAYIAVGFSPFENSFLHDCMNYLKTWQHKGLVEKFRIPCPNGGLYFGIFDETLSLQYDDGNGFPEVFVQVSASGYYSVEKSRIHVDQGSREVVSGDKGILSPVEIQFDFGGESDSAEDNETLSEVLGESKPKSPHQHGHIHRRPEYMSRNIVIEGHVLITRSPCLHPGDIVICKAVNNPKLRDLTNVVVFPGPGRIKHSRHPGNPPSKDSKWENVRDIPNMMSGGDLDGDQYAVIWEKKLVEPLLTAALKKRTCRNSPAEFTVPRDLEPDKDLSKKSVQDFFVRYQLASNIGLIANAWVSMMHQPSIYKEGQKAFNTKCLRLAELHSDAVDFAKTGKPALIPGDLVKNQKPHFQMDPRIKLKEFRRAAIRYFHSDSLLGQIYDLLHKTNLFATDRNPWQPSIMKTTLLHVLEIPEMETVSPNHESKRWPLTTNFPLLANFGGNHYKFKYTPESLYWTGQNKESEPPNGSNLHVAKMKDYRWVYKLEWTRRSTLREIGHLTIFCEVLSALSSATGLESPCCHRVPLIKFPWSDLCHEYGNAIRMSAVERDTLLLARNDTSDGPVYRIFVIAMCPILEIGSEVIAVKQFRFVLEASSPWAESTTVGRSSEFTISSKIKPAIQGIPRSVVEVVPVAQNSIRAHDKSTQSPCPKLSNRRTVADILERVHAELRQQGVSQSTTIPPDLCRFSDGIAVPLGLFLERVCRLCDFSPTQMYPSRSEILLKCLIDCCNCHDFFIFYDLEKDSLIDPGFDPELVESPHRFQTGNSALSGASEKLVVLPLSDVFRRWRTGPRSVFLLENLLPMVVCAEATREEPLDVMKRLFRLDQHGFNILPFDLEWAELPFEVTPSLNLGNIQLEYKPKWYLWLPSRISFYHMNEYAKVACDRADVYPVGDFQRRMKQQTCLNVSLEDLREALCRLSDRLPNDNMKKANPQLRMFGGKERTFELFKSFLQCNRFQFQRELVHVDFVKHLGFAIRLKDYHQAEMSRLLSMSGLSGESQEMQIVTGCLLDDSTTLMKDRLQCSVLNLKRIKADVQYKLFLRNWPAQNTQESAEWMKSITGQLTPEERLARISALYVASTLNLSFQRATSPFLFCCPQEEETCNDPSLYPEKIRAIRLCLSRKLQPTGKLSPNFSSCAITADCEGLILLKKRFLWWYHKTFAELLTLSGIWHRCKLLCEVGLLLSEIEKSADVNEPVEITRMPDKSFALAKLDHFSPYAWASQIGRGAPHSLFLNAVGKEVDHVAKLLREVRGKDLNISWWQDDKNHILESDMSLAPEPKSPKFESLLDRTLARNRQATFLIDKIDLVSVENPGIKTVTTTFGD